HGPTEPHPPILPRTRLMRPGVSLSATFRLLLALAALGLAVVALQNWASLINAMVLGFLVVLPATPLLYWFQRKGLPNWVAYSLTVAVFVVALLGLVTFLAVTVNRLLARLPLYLDQLQGLVQTLGQQLAGLGIDVGDTAALASLIDPARLFGLASDILLSFANALSDTLLVLFIVAFMLAEAFSLPAKVARQIQLGNAWCSRATRFNNGVRRYVTITAQLGLLAGLLDTLLLLALGVEFAVLWGFLSFLLSFVPTIGFWIALIPPLFIALLSLGWVKALAILLGYVLVNGLVDSVLKPRLMGAGLDLSPMVVFLSLVFWGMVLGPLGAILAVPLTMAVKELVLEADSENRWIAELMSAHMPPAPTPTAAAESPADVT
ncbi:MAG: AI-2E family transporter, partial [Chloroflexi bacterium]